jgi:hypothetical protein
MTTGHIPPDDRYVHAHGCGEIAMNRTRRIRRRGMAVLTVLAAAIIGTGGAAPAFARSVPPPGTRGTGRDAPPAPAHTAAVAGLHGWQIMLIAVGAVLAGAVLAVVYDRARAARRARVTAHVT